MNIIRQLIDLIRWHGMYAILDPSDDSITLSKRLYKHMDKACKGKLDTVYAFQIEGDYAFSCNPREHGWLPEDSKAPLPHIQHNAKYNCIGFYAECPTVNLMLYDYALPLGKVKLSVRPGKRGNIKYYRICH